MKTFSMAIAILFYLPLFAEAGDSISVTLNGTSYQCNTEGNVGCSCTYYASGWGFQHLYVGGRLIKTFDIHSLGEIEALKQCKQLKREVCD